MTDIITELPIALGTALGVTGESDQLYIGGLILSSLIVFGTVLALNATRKIQMPGQLFGVLLVSGVCVAVGWLDEGLFLIGLILIAVMIWGKIKEWF